MSCRKYQRLLHLNRPGDVTAREQQELDAHLATCSRCVGEWQRIQAVEARMESLRQNVPRVPDPKALTKSILAGLPDRSPRRDQPVIEAVAAALNWMFNPSLARRAAAAVCFGMICLFLGQHVLMLREVRGLEQRLSRIPHATAGFNLNYVIPLEVWAELEKDLGNGVAREALARFMQRKGNQVILAKRPVRRLMVKYRDRQLRRTLVAAKLLAPNPALKQKIEQRLKRKTPGVRPWFKLQPHRRKQP